MPIAQIYPGLMLITLLMAAGSVLARRSRFYGQLVAPRASSRYEALDGLRGFLAVAVLIHHGMSTYMRLTTGEWTTNYPIYKLFGTSSVALFFMITGFLFWGKILNDGGHFDVRNHIRGRLTRLAPMYLTIATLATIIMVWSLWPMHIAPSRIGATLFTIYAMGITKWAVLHGFDTGRTVAGVTWSLKYEWIFYGVLPLLIGLRHPRWITMMVIGYVVYFISTTHGWIHKPFGPSFNLIGGMAVAQIQHSGALSRIAWRSRWMSCVGLLILIAMPIALDRGVPILLFPLTTTLFLIIVKGNSFFGVLTSPGPKAVGTISYSVYLLHGMVLYLANPLLGRLTGPDSVTLYWLALSGVGLVAVAISAVTYRWIEHPFIEMERERRQAGVPAGQITPIYAWPNHVPLPRRLAA
ncbi:acyltransferase [soil metagenome]